MKSRQSSVRRSRVKASFALAAVVLVLASAGDASACSCMFGGGAVCQDYWNMDAVFSGTVVGSATATVDEGSYKRRIRLVRFAVAETFRGAPAPETEIATGLGGGDCGYGFREGGTYLVYARRDEKDRRLYTGICLRTKPLADAAQDLAYIRSLGETSAGASLFGSVSKRNYGWKEGEEPFKPLASTAIVVEGPAGVVTAQTDERGDFRLANLAPGEYKVRLKVPKGLTTYEMSQDAYAERKASVVERGCARIDFHLEADTRVAGRLLDAEGKPVTDATVQMMGAPGSHNSAFRSERTDAEGRFEIKDVTPGDYLLGVRIYNAPFGIVPYPRTFYPGVPTEAQATVLGVKEGDELRDLELRLPARLREYEVEGSVVWSDGRPAPGANLYLSLQEGGATTAFVMLKADGRGRFTLKVCEGLSYEVNAYTEGSGNAAGRSPQVEVPPRGSAPLKLVLSVTKK